MFKRGDSIIHVTGAHTGTIQMGPHMSLTDMMCYNVWWDDHQVEGTHTQEFIEENYELAGRDRN